MHGLVDDWRSMLIASFLMAVLGIVLIAGAIVLAAKAALWRFR